MPVGNFVFIRLTEVRRAVVTEGMTIPQAGLDPGVLGMERASQLLPCLHCLLTVGATQPGTSPSTKINPFVPSDVCTFVLCFITAKEREARNQRGLIPSQQPSRLIDQNYTGSSLLIFSGKGPGNLELDFKL